MSEYTKGPWSTYHDSKYRFKITDDKFGRHLLYSANGAPEFEGNIILAAAAPELLEALISLRSFMWSEGYADQTPSMAQADAAIAKAEGR